MHTLSLFHIHTLSLGVPASLVLLMLAIQTATKTIASRIACAGVDDLGAKMGAEQGNDSCGTWGGCRVQSRDITFVDCKLNDMHDSCRLFK